MRLAASVLAFTFAVNANGAAQLLPAGEFAARDGRPGPGKTWRLDDAAGARLATKLNDLAARTPLVIDYDHQTIRAEKNGQKAIAAGWIGSVEWRSGEGLFAKVQWTPAAKAHIDAGEYLFISPVIFFDEDTGEVTGLAMASLVNLPALVGMEPVSAELAAALAAQISLQPRSQEPHMTLLAALIATLGLPAATAEAEVIAAVKTLKDSPAKTVEKAVLPAALATALNLQAGADEAAALSAVQALKATDGTTLQTMQALNAQIATLTARLQGDELVDLVDGAIKANKLVPAQRDWAMAFGKKDMAALQGFIAGLPVIPGLAGQTGGRDPNPGAGGAAALSDDQLKVATQLGLDPAKFAEALKANA